VKFFGIDTFIEDLNELCKKRKDNYFTVKSDICNELNTCETLDIVIQKSKVIGKISDTDAKLLLKTRYRNSAMNEGKSAGFRTYSIVNKEKNEITFLSVYPKIGKFGKEDLSDSDLKEVLIEYINQYRNYTLKLLDINNKLQIIE